MIYPEQRMCLGTLLRLRWSLATPTAYTAVRSILCIHCHGYNISKKMPNKCPTSYFYVPFYAANLSSCLSSSVQSSAYICSSITLFNPRFMIPSNDFASTTARHLLMSMLKSNLHTVFKKSMISSGCLKVMFIVLILFTSFSLTAMKSFSLFAYIIAHFLYLKGRNFL